MRTRRFGPILTASVVVFVAACGSDGDATDGESESTSAASESAALPDGCPPVEGADTATQQFDEPPPFCLDPDVDYSARVTTSAGDVVFDLDQEAAPTTVNNFVFLARNHYFDDTICHRAIQDFVVQCGDPTGTGTGGPGYVVDDELPAEGAYAIGSIAMANPGQPDSNGSQFFIISGESGAALPPLYSLFGAVPEDDLDVVEQLNGLGGTGGSETPTEEIRITDVEIIEN